MYSYNPLSEFYETGDFMKFVLGIDFGGGASKTTLLGEDGVIYAEATYEYPTLNP